MVSVSKANQPFYDWTRSSDAHFNLYLFAAISRLLRQVANTLGSVDEMMSQFPFLLGYWNELAGHEPNSLGTEEAIQWWQQALHDWEVSATEHLPLRALREVSGLDEGAMTLLMCAGLIEEDARFGWLFETMQSTPGQQRPTMGLLQSWWCDQDNYSRSRGWLRQLHEIGLLQLNNIELRGFECSVQVQPLLWEALRGEAREELASWAHYKHPAKLAKIEDLIITIELKDRLKTLPTVLTTGEAQALIVRGPQHNGRKTILGAVARTMGYGVLEIIGLDKPNDPQWQVVATLATLLRAIPVVDCDVSPGESFEIPRGRGYLGVIGVITGKQGGITGSGAEHAITLQVEMPDVGTRRSHWQQGFGTRQVNGLDQISERFRLTSGNIRRAARMASAHAALNGRTAITLADVHQASRTLNRQTLETQAARVMVSGDWNDLAVSEETMQELRYLEVRCRHRERLRAAANTTHSDQLNVGVRALFSGPSGTGKTLAAKLLASALQMDLYRLDLSAVVNKYIGETEKNLNQVFARAEELDVMLLLDEGDALLTSRTEVGNANDRYANLETNYLLQRLESFEGILIVTTNASDRIDSAFQRRMDVQVHFPPPDVMERWMIWQLHLPVSNQVQTQFLEEVATRCELSGGQIRNAMLHASTLALTNGGVVNDKHLESALQREYRKAGMVYPLRMAESFNHSVSSFY